MDKIGRYRLTRRLGSGSFATVWQGHDDDLDVPVAVKVLADNWADNDDVRNRFLGEARLMRRIRDDRIVRVYDIGSLDDGRPYFVMDFADGGSLEDLRKQGIPPTLALRLCAEACRALHVLHINAVIHRDVTPGNILLNRTRDNGVKVLIADLGVAKSMVDMGQTMTAGTPAYMALEQANGIAKLDHRADIYSLAAVTYAMLTGRPPFPVKTLADVLQRDPTARPAPIADAIGAPAMLDGVLQSALAAQPGLRPRSALELADALDSCADQINAPQPSPGPSSPPASAGPSAGPSQVTMAPSWSGAHAVAGGPVPNTPIPTASATPYGSTVGSAVNQPAFNPYPQNRPQHGYSVSTANEPPNPGMSSYPSLVPERHGRPVTFYVLVLVSALALFVISLLVTIVALSS